MTWTVPEHSKSEVDRAGKLLTTEGVYEADLQNALTIINNWRASHSFPLNTFQVSLRTKARRIDDQVLVAQRIKRLSSIELKLSRFPTMKVSQMQDIGGCRAVLKNIAHVRELEQSYRKSSIKHKALRTDDYISAPKASGYRGIHLIYRYFSDRSDSYNGLLIEIQMRSILQHAWATAVETVGTFLKQSLKSSQGHDEWLRFFVVMSSAIALREKSTTVPGTSTTPSEVKAELRKLSTSLDVRRRLQAYGDTLKALEETTTVDGQYFLMALDPQADTVTIRSYRRADLDRAAKDYLTVEKSLDEAAGAEAVLVSVDSIAALKKAYPNYFLDTRAFLAALEQAIK
ncbi:RelA/SpoT domain-containing protein [Pseudothauera rhizosphaerae]|uniref:(P)ppGpp synthetase n=1 Tax=Pseudothauera rhizosphaerae TaxID=2565932 RepID=A0A4S4AYM8_9RHOO|nr:RelA/SpoT domain-containing protein [Pseudothauera rhizosphaerae]THF65266.1 (p)ppGpp synthetase [Pseudothauera rhizosphaerae]